MERLLIVSNRLPVRIINADNGSLTVAPSMGGIATALKGPQQRLGGLWLGWPGDTIAEEHRQDVTNKLAEIQAAPIFLDSDEIRAFYAGFSNSMLWPLFHSAIDALPLDASDDYEVYCKVNRKYAMAAAELVEERGIVWIHDYQLCLVPGMLRALRPDLRIGFFLHIPFPAADVFRVLPWRKEILQGIARSDLVGFHTASYRDHFMGACQQLIDARRSGDSLIIDGHITHVGVYPMSVDFEHIDQAARNPAVDERVAELKRQAHGKKIIVGVDRLDYTKGLPRRMLAVDTLLRRWPQLQDDIHVIQVTAPSREEVDAYADFKRRVHEVAGRINAELGTTTDVPIHLLHRAIVGDELYALYRAADVMLVTPLRDGMNLVAKEFVAARCDGDGVLILSELAGAAGELEEAVIVNPYDVQGMARAIRDALSLGGSERRRRMQALRRRVSSFTAQDWANAFLDHLQDPPGAKRKRGAVERALADAALHRHVTLLLDYDGTIVDIAPTPDQAKPSAEALAALAELSSLPQVDVYVVSGRKPQDLDRWLGDSRVGLIAEHGAWLRPMRGVWQRRVAMPAWLDAMCERFRQLADRYPGALVERKTSGVAFHTRMIVGEEAEQAYAAASHLVSSLLPTFPSLSLLQGDRVVEARAAGARKSTVVSLVSDHDTHTAIIAAGDDATDEELFAALPPGSIAIHVGQNASCAPYCVADPTALLQALANFAEARRRIASRAA